MLIQFRRKRQHNINTTPLCIPSSLVRWVSQLGYVCAQNRVMRLNRKSIPKQVLTHRTKNEGIHDGVEFIDLQYPYGLRFGNFSFGLLVTVTTWAIPKISCTYNLPVKIHFKTRNPFGIYFVHWVKVYIHVVQHYNYQYHKPWKLDHLSSCRYVTTIQIVNRSRFVCFVV